MGHSVKHAKVSLKKDRILEFSTRLIEDAMPDNTSYETAMRIAEALHALKAAIEACHEGKRAGKSLEYVLELRICKDTVSHQLTRDGNAAEGQHPSLHATISHTKRSLMQAIIKFAWPISRLCINGARVYASMDGMR